MLCIKNADNSYRHQRGSRVRTLVGDILIDGGKILEVGSGLHPDADCTVRDASGLHIYPGFVEAHCHVGLDGTAVGYEGQDYNEYNDPVTPQLRAEDGINPFDPALREAALAGVTCIATGPGSSNAIGGTFAAIKTAGKRVDEMLVKSPVAMKCAFGENPKRCYRDHGISSRMTNAALIREAISKALQYRQKKEAAGSDPLKAPGFRCKMRGPSPRPGTSDPAKGPRASGQRLLYCYPDREGIRSGSHLEHVTEGHLVADELSKENLPLAVGPTLTHASKFELKNKSWITPGILAEAGCRVSIITDAPVIPLHYLPLCASFAHKAGNVRGRRSAGDHLKSCRPSGNRGQSRFHRTR